MKRVIPGCMLALGLVAATAQAQEPALFRGADLKLGEKLIAEHKCVACHQQKVGGDGSAIYRPAGRINTPGFLRGMVEQCNTEMNLGLFPEEVTAVAAVLNRDHYRFK
jgi:cytochrome c peroxidase